MVRIMSARERRLWGWTLLVLVAIVTSAVFSGSLVGALGSETVVGLAFGGFFAMAILSVLGLALSGARSRDAWVALAVVTTIAMIPVRSGVTALERTHLFEYGLLAVVLYEAVSERRKHGGRMPPPALAAICLAAAVGWLEEALQAVVPGRVYDLRDVAINATAALAAVSAVATIRWAGTALGRAGAEATADRDTHRADGTADPDR